MPITLRRKEIKGKQVDLEHVGTCPDRNLTREGVMKLVDLKKRKTQISESSSARMLVVTSDSEVSDNTNFLVKGFGCWSESQSYSAKVRVQPDGPQNLNQIARNRCPNRILLALQKRALKRS